MVQSINLINDLNDIPRMSAWIDLLAEEVCLPSDKAFQLNLALEEAVVNIINYAYPEQHNMPITIEAQLLEDRIIFVIDDMGIPFDPTTHEDPDTTLPAEERPIGGLGIMLMRQYMADISYQYHDGHNRLSLTMLR